MSVSPQSIADADQETENGCIGCDSESDDEYPLVLDGQQTVYIRLCKECYNQCYEKVLRADWIEEPK
jgi:hypothetical protein